MNLLITSSVVSSQNYCVERCHPRPTPSTGFVPLHIFANAAKRVALMSSQVAATYPRVWRTGSVVSDECDLDD